VYNISGYLKPDRLLVLYIDSAYMYVISLYIVYQILVISNLFFAF